MKGFFAFIETGDNATQGVGFFAANSLEDVVSHLKNEKPNLCVKVREELPSIGEDVEDVFTLWQFVNANGVEFHTFMESREKLDIIRGKLKEMGRFFNVESWKVTRINKEG